MKKVKFYAAALASLLMLGACSSSDDLGGGTSESKDGKSYIAVNIKSVGTAGAGSRADGYDQGNGSYEDGTANEGAVNKVRFYFFNNDGTPYVLKDTQYNYKELDAAASEGADHVHTIEGKTAAMMVIEGETKTAPAYMIAVVNPQTLKNLPKGVNYRESQLRDELTDESFVKITTDGTSKQYSDFVMSNSVYAENGARVCASSVSGHVAENEEEAEKNPVDIYVERVVAKATTKVNPEKGWKQIESGADAGKWQIKVGEINVASTKTADNNLASKADDKRDVYAVVSGWGLADENGKAELEKQIDVTSNNWTSAILGIDPWTSPDYHRCFWSASVGITPENGSNPSVNHSFSEFTTQFGTTPLYTCPNTPTYEQFNNEKINDKPYDNDLTKVLVAAKLVYYDDDNNPHPADICKYRGIQILGANDVLTQVAKDHDEYWTVDPNNDQKHVLLAPTDLEYSTTSFGTGTGVDDLKSYEVRPVLKAGVKVYKKKADGTFETTDSNDELTKALAQSPVQVRKDGMTYYYTPIRHLAQSKLNLGYYGVVRNHSYHITIDSMQGFGTPVYDPDAVIDPVIPKDTETYLAARINVLSWRVVPSSVDLDATK